MSRSNGVTTVAGVVAVLAGLVLIAGNAVFDSSGPARAADAFLGGALVLVGVTWLLTDVPPRVLPAATMLLGIATLLAPAVLFYRRLEDPLLAWLVHAAVGLGVASVAYWAGRRTGTPRVDRV